MKSTSIIGTFHTTNKNYFINYRHEFYKTTAFLSFEHLSWKNISKVGFGYPFCTKNETVLNEEIILFTDSEP